jgi:hypothetical protein
LALSVGANSAVIELVFTLEGVQEHVAVHGETNIATDEHIVVESALNVTAPARSAVAVNVTATSYVAVVAFDGRATETLVKVKADPSCVLLAFVKPDLLEVTVTVLAAPFDRSKTVTMPLDRLTVPAVPETVQL